MTLPSNRRLPPTKTLLFAVVIFVCGAMTPNILRGLIPANSGWENATASLLHYMAPIEVDIVFHPTKLSTPVAEWNDVVGTARFTFTNTTDRPISIAFPPHRVFDFSASNYSEEVNVPEFVGVKQNVLIQPKKSVSFEGRVKRTFIGDMDSFLKGGIGFIGFVFERPPSEDATGEFCVGTVFPRYSVVMAGKQTR